MNREYFDYQVARLNLDKELREHLLYLFEKELGGQVQEILSAFADASTRRDDAPPETNAPPAWASSAAIRILAQMELPTIGKLRLNLAHYIHGEVEQRVRTRAMHSTP